MTKKYCQYRRLRSGDWGIMGPADVVKPDAQVIVKKKDGSTKIETVEALVGKPFDVDGVPHQYATVDDTGYGNVCRARGCSNVVADAPHHRAMHGFCGWCAFDEYDM